MELSSQVLFFAVHAVLCYCAGAKLLCALELLRQAYLLLRFVLRFCVFLQLGLCRSHWTGSIKVSWCCGRVRSMLPFWTWRRKSYWSGCIKVAMILWCWSFSR
jgi:hypothetical protein